MEKISSYTNYDTQVKRVITKHYQIQTISIQQMHIMEVFQILIKYAKSIEKIK